MVIEDLEKIKELDTEKKILQDIIRSYSTYKTNPFRYSPSGW